MATALGGMPRPVSSCGDVCVFWSCGRVSVFVFMVRLFCVVLSFCFSFALLLLSSASAKVVVPWPVRKKGDHGRIRGIRSVEETKENREGQKEKVHNVCVLRSLTQYGV